MRAFERGRALADELGVGPSADLTPVLERLGLEVEPWRFAGRVREVIVERTIGIDDRLPEPWVRWLTAHAVGHHLLHTGTSLYVESWQWVATLKAERQAEEFAAGLLAGGADARTAGLGGLASRCAIPDAKAPLVRSLLGLSA